MPWPHLLALPLTVLPSADITPAAGIQTDITTYLLGYGVTGIIALALAWLVYRGWRLVSPDREKEIRESGRADLLRECEQLRADADRIRAERDRAAEQRDELSKIAQDRLVPLLTSFVATSQSLLPLLQELVRTRERP